MAKQRFSILGIIGTIKGTSFYNLVGIPVSRKSNPPDRDKIYNDPRFKSVKANCVEFGGASVLSKAICSGLQENVPIYKDSYFTSRLTGICRKVIQKGRGNRGSREANLFNHPEALKGFQLHKAHILNHIYTANPIISINETRDSITVKIANSGKLHLNKCPITVTHFKLTAALSTVSVHKWEAKTQKYQPVDQAANALGAAVDSPLLLCKIEHPEIILELKTPRPIPPEVAITVWLGIQFGNENDNHFIPFQTTKAMECIAVL